VIAEILTIGDEILRGEIVDSNKAFLAERLLQLEVETRFQSSVRDDPEDMRDAFLRARGRAEVVMVSGGLGPTRDDLTVEVLARSFGRELVLHEPSLAAIRGFFARIGREMAENNARQALVPAGAEVLENPVGTAPGCLLEVPAESGAGSVLFFCLPGVPRELMKMMDEQVLPRIAARRAAAGRPAAVMRAVLLRTFGLGESNLDQELRDVAREGDVTLGFRTAFPDNYLRPVARGATAAEAEARLAKVCDAIRERLGALVYGSGDETMEQVVGALLAARGATLASAESCTGGLVGARVTAVPGSSRYYRGGVVAYSNEAKETLLEVPGALLRQHGAVSAEVARAMAEGARRRLGADLAVSTTGISGPEGGTAEKPVGLVYVGFASPEGSAAYELLFPLDRERHRALTAQVALDCVRRYLLGEEPVATRWSARR
jgi:nicotinamide-nucleotide amidase